MNRGKIQRTGSIALQVNLAKAGRCLLRLAYSELETLV